jgi:peptidoglycan/LPS O-acetylase OafA/YrhL
VRPAHRDFGIEAMRGIAAFVVINWHMIVGFFPGRAGIFPGADPQRIFMGHVWFALANGPAAVAFFFVISGFVLTRRALRDADSLAIARGAAKRWLRLAVPVVLTVMLSWALFAVHAYSFARVGPLVGSPWLTDFAYGLGGQPMHPDALQAFLQGAWWMFVRGDTSYDSSLWTMRLELAGSFIVFGLALALIELRAAHGALRGAMVIGVAAMCQYVDSRLIGFLVGIGLAELLNWRTPRIPWPLAIGMTAIVIVLVGYWPATGHYAWMAWLPGGPPEPNRVHTLAAAIALVMVEGSGVARRVLSGRLFVILGKLSFPVYLLHVLVLCSAGCAAWLAVQGSVSPRMASLIAAAVTWLGTLIAAAPLVWFDAWWTGLLGTWTRRLIPRRRPASG